MSASLSSLQFSAFLSLRRVRKLTRPPSLGSLIITVDITRIIHLSTETVH